MAQINDFPWRYWAQRHPAACALDSGNERLNWQQLAQRLDALVIGFRQQGVSAGCRVVLRSKNSVPTLLAALALLQMGVRLLPLNPQLPVTLLDELLPGLGLDFMLNLDNPVSVALPALILKSAGGQPQYHWQAHDIATLTLTSGSSGVPKAVAHTFHAHLASAEGVNALMGFCATDRWLLSLPLYHVSGQGIVWRWLLAGATLVLADDIPLPVALNRCSFASLVPTQLWRVLQQPETPSRLTAVLLGGAAISPALVAQAEARGIRCWCGYGMTEAASTVCGKRADGRCGVGVPLAGREIRLVNEEIWLRSSSLTSGYWRDGVLVPVTDADGWLHTRDRGAWVDGELQVVGRLDNQFFSGGEGIQPEEIERVLLGHPAVSQAYVVPQNDEEFGQRPVALLALTKGVDVDVIARWARDKLAGFQYPVDWLLLPAEMSNGGIKVSRQPLYAWVAQQRRKTR